jgi:hypothetical protein
MDKFNINKNENPFKRAFGYVFQEYIGRLLKFYFSTWSVIPEIKYKIKKVDHDTVDWFVKKDDKLILIEVKQSSIFLDTKVTGSLELIKNDLQKTLNKAAVQLKRTEEHILSKKYPELDIFSGIKDFIKIIVVNDPFYNANIVGKKLIQKLLDDSNFNFEIINITDFESFLENQQESETMFEVLFMKSLNYSDRYMDMKEFLFKIFPNGDTKPRFLREIFNLFFKSIRNK